MSQGSTTYNLLDTAVTIQDGAHLDAFSRLRTSDPASLFSVQCQYNNAPILMESGNTGTGVAPSHSANTRMVALSATAGTGTSFIQSYQYFPYQPGKSHLVFLTAVIGAAVAKNIVDLGLFDSANGIFLRQGGDGLLYIVRRTKTSGSIVDNEIVQSDWNLDKLDGTGTSGVTLDISTAIILMIDLQFLGMGRVRVGFDIGGQIIYVHEFLNANLLTVPYMQTATLPVQMLLTADASSDPKTTYFKCAAVSSEGGMAEDFAFAFSTPEATVTASSGARTHLVSVRPKTTFNSITNRETFILDSVEILVTGNNPVLWELCVGQAITGASYADINTAYSAFEYSAGTISGSPAIVIASGYCAASATVKGAVARQIFSRYPITLDRAGAVRANGTVSLIVTGIGNTSATRGTINFREIR